MVIRTRSGMASASTGDVDGAAPFCGTAPLVGAVTEPLPAAAPWGSGSLDATDIPPSVTTVAHMLNNFNFIGHLPRPVPLARAGLAILTKNGGENNPAVRNLC
jgi:hypothetical protein